jgi:ribonuclease P/MRP protein subunit POP5
VKRLPPSIRHRKRYIAFRLIGLNNPADRKEIALKLMDSMLSLFGEVGSSHAGIWIEYFNGELGIVRCNREATERVKIALTLIDEVNGEKVLPLILGVSGTIRKCKRKYMEVFKNANTTDGL